MNNVLFIKTHRKKKLLTIMNMKNSVAVIGKIEQGGINNDR